MSRSIFARTPRRQIDTTPYLFADKWVFPRAIPPTIAQYISMKRGYTWSPAFTFAIYAIWFLIFAKMLSLRLKALIAEYGYLDPKSPRNHTPDTRTSWTVVRILCDLPWGLLPNYHVFFTLLDRYSCWARRPHVVWNRDCVRSKRVATSLALATCQCVHLCLYLRLLLLVRIVN